MSDQLFVVVRTVTDTAELVGAWFDQVDAASVANDLGPGHHVSPVPMVAPGAGSVAHVWRCRVAVLDRRVAEVSVPERLAGASRLVVDAADMPTERVHVDDQAAELEAQVNGVSQYYVEAFAVTPERARELAVATAEGLSGSDSKM